MSIEAISTNCATKSVECERVTARNLLRIKIPKARGFKYITLNEEISQLAVERDLNFLDYRYVEGYEAIWSKEHDVIECEVELPQESFQFEHMFRNNEDASEAGKLYIDTHLPDVTVELSEVTDEFNLLDLCKDIGRPRPSISMRASRFDRRKSWSTSLKITGINVSNHDEAKEVIETIFASICFQFDCKTSIPLMLAVEHNYSREKTDTSQMENLKLTAVNQKYDNEALSLYWYAQSAVGMPLLQYLALYQVIEFYYPIYSELAAQKKVANILKDPCFNSHSEKDIARIFNIVKSASSTRSELSQLEATFKECIDLSLLRDWLKSETKRDEYFRSKNAIKLSEYKINSNADDEDLLRQVWQRFYNIRCRIVHTKGAEGELEVLHPQSKEVKYLDYDIELANFLAHRVLISSSKPINTT
ncbi:hypothetical protein [Pseudoalteromonas ruthenica]|uniref:hypothetical protein n=1 Tax=Pseudoalteromonas ruthenica TaxID=151081 RepID=UPI00110A9390|nr:hypothetical protein [Pseudoalteromonas ruthenica]TMO46159.1 hypothetical protein CWC24_10645 [Pseudoalteromonas ruthenica]TMO51582.1 hypothetical protein CWC23_06560 [Pseudoalteromonas ruthenica]